MLPSKCIRGTSPHSSFSRSAPPACIAPPLFPHAFGWSRGHVQFVAHQTLPAPPTRTKARTSCAWVQYACTFHATMSSTPVSYNTFPWSRRRPAIRTAHATLPSTFFPTKPRRRVTVMHTSSDAIHQRHGTGIPAQVTLESRSPLVLQRVHPLRRAIRDALSVNFRGRPARKCRSPDRPMLPYHPPSRLP